MTSGPQSNEASVSSFTLDGNRALFLHRSDPDGVVIDAHFRIVLFESPGAAQAHAEDIGLTYERPAESHDPNFNFDAIVAWCRSPDGSQVNCKAFIEVWNLLNDICLTVPWLTEPFRGVGYGVVYNKLFWGLNLSVFTPEGKHWTPVWRESQIRALRRVLTHTIFEFGQLLPPDF